MIRPVINKSYVSRVLSDMHRLDYDATEKLLLAKVSVNEKLRFHPTVHFYDDKLSVFGAIAGMTTDDAPNTDQYVDPNIIINFFNELIDLDAEAIANLIELRIPCNSELANHPDILVLVDSDINGNPINPKIGLLGVLNGITGINKETGLGMIGASFDDEGFLLSFVIPYEVQEVMIEHEQDYSDSTLGSL